MYFLFKFQTKCDCNGIALGAQVCNSNYDARDRSGRKTQYGQKVRKM